MQPVFNAATVRAKRLHPTPVRQVSASFGKLFLIPNPMSHRHFPFFVLPVVLLIGVAAPSVSAAEDWPQFRGPGGEGVSTATGVPVEWNATNNIAWKTDIAGQGWSSPVLSRGRVYVTTAVSEASPSLRAICVDAESGKIVWDTEVFKADPAAAKKMHPKNSPASATPIVTMDRLYVHFGHLGTAALDLSGKVIWRQTDLKYPPVHGNGGSPILLDQTLIFSCDGGRDPFIAALDSGTGAVKWKTPRNTHAKRSFSFCTPLAIDLDGIKQVVLPGSGFVGGYNPADGHELWRVDYGEGYSVVPRPVYSHGLLFVSSGFDTPIVYAIQPKGAEGDATAHHVVWTHRKSAPNTPSMLVVGDELYFVSDGGIATCADVMTGAVHWTHRLDGNFSASPVLAEGRIYFQSEAGMGYVIKAGKTYESLAENDLGERSLASYAVSDGAIFIRTQSHLWKVATANRLKTAGK